MKYKPPNKKVTVQDVRKRLMLPATISDKQIEELINELHRLARIYIRVSLGKQDNFNFYKKRNEKSK